MPGPTTSAEIAVANIRATLGYQGKTFGDLAEATGINADRLSFRNTGRTEYTLTDLDLIGKALDVSPADLITPRT